MLAIKLRPVGKKKQISYRVVVMEKKSKLQGKFIEDLGWYNPHTNASLLKKDRVEYWIKSGAQPTDTVHNVLVKESMREGPKTPKHGKSKKAPEAQAPETQQVGQKTPEKPPTEETREEISEKTGEEKEPIEQIQTE